MSHGFSGDSVSKESTCNTGEPDLIPGSGRSSGEVNDHPFQYSCLGNPMNRGAWWATVHRFVSQTSLHLVTKPPPEAIISHSQKQAIRQHRDSEKYKECLPLRSSKAYKVKSVRRNQRYLHLYRLLCSHERYIMG